MSRLPRASRLVEMPPMEEATIQADVDLEIPGRRALGTMGFHFEEEPLFHNNPSSILSPDYLAFPAPEESMLPLDYNFLDQPQSFQESEFDRAAAYEPLPEAELAQPSVEGHPSGEPAVISKDDIKDTTPYATLIFHALFEAPGHQLQLHDIYKWMEQNSSRCTSDHKGWQNSVRHNLSMNQAFEKVDITDAKKSRKKIFAWRLSNEALARKFVLPTTRYRGEKKNTGKKEGSPKPKARPGLFSPYPLPARGNSSPTVQDAMDASLGGRLTRSSVPYDQPPHRRVGSYRSHGNMSSQPQSFDSREPEYMSPHDHRLPIRDRRSASPPSLTALNLEAQSPADSPFAPATPFSSGQNSPLTVGPRTHSFRMMSEDDQFLSAALTGYGFGPNEVGADADFDFDPIRSTCADFTAPTLQVESHALVPGAGHPAAENYPGSYSFAWDRPLTQPYQSHSFEDKGGDFGCGNLLEGADCFAGSASPPGQYQHADAMHPQVSQSFLTHPSENLGFTMPDTPQHEPQALLSLNFPRPSFRPHSSHVEISASNAAAPPTAENSPVQLLQRQLSAPSIVGPAPDQDSRGYGSSRVWPSSGPVNPLDGAQAPPDTGLASMDRGSHSSFQGK